MEHNKNYYNQLLNEVEILFMNKGEKAGIKILGIVLEV